MSWPNLTSDGISDTNLRLAGQVAHSYGWLGSDAGASEGSSLTPWAHPTLTEAAQDLGIHQSALVTQINRLERDLGEALLERAERGRAMKLTPFGEKVIAAISTMQGQIASQPRR
ncbi:LysR family transcriptional regulator [Streptomyces sp. CC228A]|uniref:LysR family transcriptional regulator n=1 Tax=Streptomyces sp. CC228A TaxID=2898186 RepID=UPI0027E41B2A|nr:LysR family transcriptional regulator [Streptomyces sp. CC228A]